MLEIVHETRLAYCGSGVVGVVGMGKEIKHPVRSDFPGIEGLFPRSFRSVRRRY